MFKTISFENFRKRARTPNIGTNNDHDTTHNNAKKLRLQLEPNKKHGKKTCKLMRLFIKKIFTHIDFDF